MEIKGLPLHAPLCDAIGDSSDRQMRQSTPSHLTKSSTLGFRPRLRAANLGSG